MRTIVLLLVASVSTAALANTTPNIEPPPSWVKRVPLGPPGASNSLPVRVLLLDQQVNLEKGSVSRYTEAAAVIQTAAGLGAGNVALTWRPDIDTISVNAITITRAGQTINVLAKQKFTTIRRETNLEEATLDGRLTASLIIDGVEVGDVITLATTLTSRDPTLAGHVEAELGQWNGAIDHAHARLHWAKGLPVRVTTSPGLPAAVTTTDATGTTIELTGDKLQPLVPPKGAPPRYSVGRFVDATDYQSWADLARLMTPLFAKAASIGPSSPLNAEIARIRAASPSPVARASAALDLVESKTRYVALEMGVGGYVPAAADATWASRLGDCKAKTALLLALLHGLDIAAVPILVSSGAGDGLDQRVPMIGRFDHVLVRATIAGRDYYLDGTRSGDKDVERLEVPAFRWGLPLVAGASRLARLSPAPRTTPDSDFALAIDARGGIYAPAKAHSDVTFRHDAALGMKTAFEALSDAQRNAALRDFFRGTYDFIEPSKMSASFDPGTGVETLSMDGTATLKWDDSYFRIPGSGLAWSADFGRPDGPDRDVPFAVDFPSFARSTTTVDVPPGIALWDGKVGHDVDQTLAGIHYHREASLTNGTLRMVKSQLALTPEVDATTARAAQARLRALDDEDAFLSNDHYVATDADIVALKATTPDTAAAFFRRGLLYSDRAHYAEAAADFTEAHRLNDKDAWVLANRAIANFWLGHYDDAKADASAAATIEPTNPVAARVRGLLAERDGDPKGAAEAFTASLATQPGNVFAITHRANAYRTLGNYPAALKDIDSLLQLNPQALDVRLLRVNVLRSQGDDAGVLREARLLEEGTPRDSYALVTAAKIYAAEHQRDKALATVNAALAIKPEAILYLNRADIWDRKDIAHRRGDLEAALKLEPDMIEAKVGRAQLAFEQHDDRRAIDDYSALIASASKDLNPGALNAFHLYRAKSYQRIGDVAAAQRDIAFVEQDRSPATANQLCWQKATGGLSLTSALEDCNRAIAGSPKSAPALDSRGFVYLRLGRLDEALIDLDAALAIRPKQASSLYARSLVFARKGDAARAAADRAAAIAISDDIEAEYAEYGVGK